MIKIQSHWKLDLQGRYECVFKGQQWVSTLRLTGLVKELPRTETGKNAKDK